MTSYAPSHVPWGSAMQASDLRGSGTEYMPPTVESSGSLNADCAGVIAMARVLSGAYGRHIHSEGRARMRRRRLLATLGLASSVAAFLTPARAAQEPAAQAPGSP